VLVEGPPRMACERKDAYACVLLYNLEHCSGGDRVVRATRDMVSFTFRAGALRLVREVYSAD